jgi:CRP/FNR family transcriptional regulator, cyclic AMP receptor protein
MNIAVNRQQVQAVGPDKRTDFPPLARGLGTVMDFAAGEIIFREGDPARHMYVVLKGKVEISAKGKLIATVDEGEALGTLSLIDGMPRTITAEAVEPSELALLDEKKFRFMVEETPNFV